ncbi:MAG: type I-E CRISPR-associated protein Cse1/CasA, partial [Agathobaculum sp.]
MTETAFNLVDEPWIRVLQPDGAAAEVSLRDVLLRAHTFADLGGELPTQNIAVLRLLLAVLHTVFSRMDETGAQAPLEEPDDAIERWVSLWSCGALPEEPIVQYLEQWHERFWLFHPTRPFGQSQTAQQGTQCSAAKLIGELSESGNKLRLFPSRTGEG